MALTDGDDVLLAILDNVELRHGLLGAGSVESASSCSDSGEPGDAFRARTRGPAAARALRRSASGATVARAARRGGATRARARRTMRGRPSTHRIGAQGLNGA